MRHNSTPGISNLPPVSSLSGLLPKVGQLLDMPFSNVSSYIVVRLVAVALDLTSVAALVICEREAPHRCSSGASSHGAPPPAGVFGIFIRLLIALNFVMCEDPADSDFIVSSELFGSRPPPCLSGPCRWRRWSPRTRCTYLLSWRAGRGREEPGTLYCVDGGGIRLWHQTSP